MLPGNALHVDVQDALHQLAQQRRVTRQIVSGLYLYTAIDRTIQQGQLLTRRNVEAVPSAGQPAPRCTNGHRTVERVQCERRHFGASQSAAEKHGKNRAVAQALVGRGIWDAHAAYTCPSVVGNTTDGRKRTFKDRYLS